MGTFDIDGTDIKIEISEFKGKTRVDIRRWFKVKGSDEFARTTKGISLSLDEWNLLKIKIDDIDQRIKAGIE